MKTINRFKAMAAVAVAVATLASCSKPGEEIKPEVDRFQVTLSFANDAAAGSRADGPAAVKTTKVGIDDGYICFVGANNSITDVWTVSSSATSGKNILNTSLGTSPVTLDNIPGTSQKVYMVINKRTLSAVPTVGQSMATYLANEMKVEDQGAYTSVTSTGSANLDPTADPEKKAAKVTLNTKVARIQVQDISFDDAITTASVDGIFINGFYSTMKLDGTANTLKSSTEKTDYVKGGGIFENKLDGYVYDIVDKDMGPVNINVTPDNAVWGYNLFVSATPQIIIKLSGLTVDGTAIVDPQFVTVNGFKDANGNVANLAGGMIYTISAGSLFIKPEHLSPVPGTTPFSVDVTVEQVEWDETFVTPNM